MGAGKSQREAVRHPADVLHCGGQRVAVPPEAWLHLGMESLLREVLDETAQQGDDRLALCEGLRAQVHALIEEAPQLCQRGRLFLHHPDLAGGRRSLDGGGDEGSDLSGSTVPATLPHECRDLPDVEEAGTEGIVEVMTAVRNPVGEANHATFRGTRRRPAPAVMSYAVHSLHAEVEGSEGDIGTPHGMVVAAWHVGAERVLAGVAEGTVATVVSCNDKTVSRCLDCSGRDPTGG